MPKSVSRDSPAPLDETPDEKIVREAKQRFRRVETWEATARQRFIEDEKFANGDSENMYQWPDALRNSRGFGTQDERPCLTINKTRQHCLQIINDARQNKTAIRVKPAGGQSTFEAAQVLEGIVRHIEYISDAQSAYATATRHQVEGGIGYIRIATDYADGDTFDQEIFIRRVKNPLGIYMDPDIQMADGSDARYAFAFEDMPRDEFEARYPDYADVGHAALNNTDGWISDDHIRVAEYFRAVEHKDELVQITDPQTGQTRKFRRSELLAGEKELLDGVIDDPMTVIREINETKIEWFLIAGNEIIERRKWPGRYIPIARVPGEETVFDGEMDRKGHVRALKDAQRMYNYNAPLALDTPLPTPTGWTTMGAVRPGDALLDENGLPASVAGISPTFLLRDCYRVEFDDGSSIVADGEHKWAVEERGKRNSKTWDWSKKTVTTAQLAPKKHFIWASKPLDLPQAELPIDPYILGAWLGDGSSSKPVIHSGFVDMDEMRGILEKTGASVGEPRIYGSNSCAEITIFGIRKSLSALGLLNNKHIPEIYLRASRSQREALLQGLMDTDGNTRGGQCSFISTIPALAAGFAELLRSLGVKGKMAVVKGVARQFPNGQIYQCADADRFTFTADCDFPLFRLRRKIALHEAPRGAHARRTKRHRIVSVTRVASVPTKCVCINSDTHLFLAGEGMIPTHNSAQVEFGALQSKIPYAAPAQAIEGYETYWQTANTANHSILPYNHADDEGNPIPAPQRQSPPIGSPAYQEGLQNAANDMMLVSGQYQADFGAPSNERSGVAIQQRQRQGATATYHYIDHLAMAIRFLGKIVIDLVPKIYDTKRVIKIMAEDGTDSEVLIDPTAALAYMKQQQKTRTAAEQVIVNPNIGRYDVVADVGPDFATRRQEAFNALSQIAQSNGELMNVVGDLLFKSADFEYADEIADRLERMIPPQAKGDGPDPQVMALQQQLQGAQQLIAALGDKLKEAMDKSSHGDQEAAIRTYEALTKRIDVLLKNQPAPQIASTLEEDAAMASHMAGLDMMKAEHQAGLDLMTQQATPQAPQGAPQ